MIRRSMCHCSTRSRHSSRYTPSTPGELGGGAAGSGTGRVSTNGKANTANHAAASRADTRTSYPSAAGM
ncbi:Uncharacterised protein [Mycobacteroides abscessus subsp. massiliense]|nr:Uncharacterised protein [Mycobacteroides abscessus subsp. massiliense]